MAEVEITILGKTMSEHDESCVNDRLVLSGMGLKLTPDGTLYRMDDPRYSIYEAQYQVDGMKTSALSRAITTLLLSGYTPEKIKHSELGVLSIFFLQLPHGLPPSGIPIWERGLAHKEGTAAMRRALSISRGGRKQTTWHLYRDWIPILIDEPHWLPAITQFESAGCKVQLIFPTEEAQ